MEVAEEKNESKEKKVKEKVIDIILSITEKLKELEGYKKINSRLWNISWEQGEFLELLMSLYKPKNILEIGTSNGFSTLWIAKGILLGYITSFIFNSEKNFNNEVYLNTNFSNFQIDTIDAREEIAKEALQNFSSVGLNNFINVLEGGAVSLLKNLKKKYDFVFIDANKSEYLDYIKILESNDNLANNVLIIADNIISHKTTKPFKDYVIKNYNTYIINIGKGMSVSVRNNKI